MQQEIFSVFSPKKRIFETFPPFFLSIKTSFYNCVAAFPYVFFVLNKG